MGRYRSNIVAGITASTAEINVLDTIPATLTGAELGILDGVTATAAEINTLAGVTAGTVAAGKAVVTTTNKHIDALVVSDGGLALGAGAGTAITATAAQLNKCAVTTAGTAEASKVAVLGASKNLDVLGLPVSGLKIGAAGAEVAVDASAAQLNTTVVTTPGTAEASKCAVLGANKNLDTLAIADGGLKLGAGAGTAVTATAAQLNKLAGAIDSVVYNLRSRCTLAEINAGKTLVAVPATKAFRLIDCKAIAYGGSVGTVTTVDVKVGAAVLVAFAQAGLTQSTVLKDGGANAAVLADGASYVAQGAGDDLVVIKAGADADTATGVDIIVTYALD